MRLSRLCCFSAQRSDCCYFESHQLAFGDFLGALLSGSLSGVAIRSLDGRVQYQHAIHPETFAPPHPFPLCFHKPCACTPFLHGTRQLERAPVIGALLPHILSFEPHLCALSPLFLVRHALLCPWSVDDIHYNAAGGLGDEQGNSTGTGAGESLESKLEALASISSVEVMLLRSAERVCSSSHPTNLYV